jgi:hypothetical protein
MRLSPRIRVLLGLITTTLFFSVGITFLAGGGDVIGYLLIGLGTYRAYLLFKQVRWLMQPADDP